MLVEVRGHLKTFIQQYEKREPSSLHSFLYYIFYVVDRLLEPYFCESKL